MNRPVGILLVLLVAAVAAAFVLPLQPKAVTAQEEAQSKLELERTETRSEGYRITGAEIAKEDWKLKPEQFWTKLLEGAGYKVNGFGQPITLEEAQNRLRRMGAKAEICLEHKSEPPEEASIWEAEECP